MILEGNVWKYGRDVDTDAIIPARYLTTEEPEKLAGHCMEDIDAEFASKVEPGDIIVAEENFGCGSSREHAPLAIGGAKVSAVIAKSFARIFYRNAFNMGLPILESPEAAAELTSGQEIRVNLDTGEIVVLSTGKTYNSQPLPPFMQELLADGGLMAHLKKTLEAQSA